MVKGVKMRGKFRVFILIILILYLVMEIFFPVLAEKEIRNNIVEQIDSVQLLEVNANSFPAWEMILTKIDRVEINASKLVIDGLLIESIATKYRDLYIKDNKIMGENIDLKFVISEQALNKYIIEKYPELSNFRVKFVSGHAYLSGQLNFFNKKVNIQLTGKFNVKEKNIIDFEPVNLKIEKLEIPGEVVKKFIEESGFTINLNKLNMPLNVEKIKIVSARMYLMGGLYAGKAGL